MDKTCFWQKEVNPFDEIFNTIIPSNLWIEMEVNPLLKCSTLLFRQLNRSEPFDEMFYTIIPSTG